MKHLQALAMILFGACVASPTEPSPPTDDTSIPDGTHGTMRVRFFNGNVEEVHYTAVGGHAFWEGDIDLGPITHERANAIVGLDHRWPKGVVHWKFAESFSLSDQQFIRAAMAEYNARTPVQFIEGVDPSLPYIAFYVSTHTANYTTGVGPDGIDGGDETDVHILPNQTRTSAVLHELGHALGLTHEQSRADRNTVISFDPDCSDDTHQYDLRDDGFEELTPYDILSIMEYGSGSTCVPADGVSTLMLGSNCKCYPIVLKGHSHFDDSGSFKAQHQLSVLDIQAVTQMYEPKLGSVEAGDRFGAAMATGDFDGDGFQDLAVGAPGEAVGATPHTGAVFVYRGTTNGLVAWKTIGELDLAPSTAAGGDDFGFALAAGDFDGDGTDDLVIGAPGARNPISTARGGVAWVMYGSQGGPAVHNAFELFQTNLTTGVTEAGDRFGASFAVGDLDMNGRPDLAVGVLHEHLDGLQAGYVNTFTSSGHVFTALHGVRPPGPLFGSSEFGNSLAIADFDDDGINDLAVGSIGGPDLGPAVFLYHGTKTSFSNLASAFPLQTFAGNTFGTAIAVGNFDGKVFAATGHKKPELVVSAPNENQTGGGADDSGRLYLFDPQNQSAGFALVRLQVIAQGPIASDTNVFGDELGTALGVLHHPGGHDDLVAGVHMKNGNKGAVVTFKGTNNDGLAGGVVLGWPALAISNGQLQLPQSGDQLGEALAVGDFNHDGQPDAVAGMPHRNESGGAFIEYVGVSAILFAARYFDEATGGPQ